MPHESSPVRLDFDAGLGTGNIWVGNSMLHTQYRLVPSPNLWAATIESRQSICVSRSTRGIRVHFQRDDLRQHLGTADRESSRRQGRRDQLQLGAFRNRNLHNWHISFHPRRRHQIKLCHHMELSCYCQREQEIQKVRQGNHVLPSSVLPSNFVVFYRMPTHTSLLDDTFPQRGSYQSMLRSKNGVRSRYSGGLARRHLAAAYTGPSFESSTCRTLSPLRDGRALLLGSGIDYHKRSYISLKLFFAHP